MPAWSDRDKGHCEVSSVAITYFLRVHLYKELDLALGDDVHCWRALLVLVDYDLVRAIVLLLQFEGDFFAELL